MIGQWNLSEPHATLYPIVETAQPVISTRGAGDRFVSKRMLPAFPAYRTRFCGGYTAPDWGAVESVIFARGAVNRLFIRQMFFRFVFSTREAEVCWPKSSCSLLRRAYLTRLGAVESVGLHAALAVGLPEGACSPHSLPASCAPVESAPHSIGATVKPVSPVRDVASHSVRGRILSHSLLTARAFFLQYPISSKGGMGLCPMIKNGP